MDERDLVQRLLTGDEEAFETLWSEYYPRVFHFACGQLKHDRDLAEDVTQEVFVHCFEKIAQFRFESKLSTWMLSIAYRKCCRSMRDARRNVSLNAETDDGATFQDFLVGRSPDPRQAAAWGQLMIRYQDALANLKDVQRSAWILHREQGLPHDELAAIIGKTPNSCRILVSRARSRIMEELGTESLAELVPQ